MAETREREQRFSDRMSDHEALMWNIEKDPWLNPSGAAITILDRPLDPDHFRALARAVDAAQTDPSVHAIVLGAEGRTFCVGADIGVFRKNAVSE